VASGALGRAHGLDWSPATIRSELAVLERVGLVYKPHAASGRVPSAEGWRDYVRQLPRKRARPEHRRLLDVGMGTPSTDLRRGLRSTARVLSELAGCVAIGFLGAPRPGKVEALELVGLEGARVLVMLGLEDGASTVRTVDLDQSLVEGEGELGRLQGLLRELTVGRSLAQARDELRGLLASEHRRVDQCMAEALRVGTLMCVASFDPLWMQVAGHGSLVVGEQNSADAGSLAEILDLLEDYQRLAEILCQLLPASTNGDLEVSVRVDLDLELDHFGCGLGLGLGHATGLTLVGCRLGWPGADQSSSGGSPATGAVALLGSPRMDYEAVIPLVEYAARAMVARA